MGEGRVSKAQPGSPSLVLLLQGCGCDGAISERLRERIDKPSADADPERRVALELAQPVGW